MDFTSSSSWCLQLRSNWAPRRLQLLTMPATTSSPATPNGSPQETPTPASTILVQPQLVSFPRWPRAHRPHRGHAHRLAANPARAARPRRCSPLRCRPPRRTRRPLQGRTRSVGMVAGRIGMVDHPRTTQATPPAHGTDCVHVRPTLGHLPPTRADQMAAPIIERPTRSCTPASPPPSTTGHRGQCEVEAESVAHVVAGILGLDTSAYSVGYVAG